MQQLPTQQPTYETPVYDMPRDIIDYGITPTQPTYDVPNYQMPNVVNPYDTMGGIGDVLQPTYSAPNTFDSYDVGGMTEQLQQLAPIQSLPIEQPTYTAPAYEAPSALNLYDNVGGMTEQLQQLAPTQSLPMEQPVYQVPETLDIYDRSMMAPEFSSGQPLLYNLNDEDRFSTYRGFDEYAKGGAVNMRDGSFVVDARTVSELGNGSSNAGIEFLSRMGGKPVRGPGDGVSDSVKAKIGGRQEARVARDEVIFSPDAVRRIGGGSDKRGTQKLYALMEKAHKARKKAARGQDTGVRKGLA